MARVNMEIKEVRQCFQKALAKVESLQAIGVEHGLCAPQDLSELKSEIDKIHNSLDLMTFKANGHFHKLSELMRSCGSICCKKVVQPNSLMIFIQCSSCPILEFEEAFLNDDE
ncbi:hypothetical protein NYE69_26215 [Paenibacillus sp. FSL R5-0527]|uniref:hypothetical protein n=1 Tax=Paenibacillus sp. FSL R5-0527 TaxID=2975321 RepID=UPI00097A9961|nr:hypothetical protein BK140_10335 [Paenibacillus macerans]